MLDTLFRVETPEGMALALRPAGLMPRLLAYLADWALRLALFIALSLVLKSLDRMGAGLTMVVYFLLEWFYPVLFEWLPGSATPGKRMMGLKVVMDNGLPVSFSASMLRNLLRVVDFMPFAYLLGSITCMVRSDFKRLGDVLAGTLVVYRSEAPRFAGQAQAEARPPSLKLSSAQQAAVLGLAERSARLTPARLDELAQLVGPALPPQLSSQDTPGQRLMALAQWLVRPKAP